MENRLKELRKLKGLTQEQFAKLVGISQAYVSDIEKRQKRYRLHACKEVC